MGSLISYSGISTKVKAMERFRIRPEQFEAMADLGSVPEAVQFLRSNPSYEKAFSKASEDELHRGKIEQLLNLSKYHDFAKLYRFANVGQRRFLDLYFMHYEIDILKTCLRNAAGNRESAQDLSGFKEFFDKHSDMDLVQLSQCRSIEDVIRGLKEIIRMDQDEMREFLTELENGTGLCGKEIAYHGRFQVRDKAMLSLMLGTGIRVSECVGLDLEDIDLTKNAAHIQRKGGREATVYYNDEVKENLRVYLEERTGQQAASGHESALFLSREQRRISVRGVEYLVKKYASVVTPDKRITPHKLRSSYGTALYAKTNDIYLVGSVLGHKNINVTAKFYTDIEEKKKKSVKDLDLLN